MGTLKMNADGAFDVESHRGGAAFVIRNNIGNLVFAGCEGRQGPSVIYMEAWALRLGLK